MKLKTSNITSNFGKKPHIKKGYYAGKLLSVKPFTDKSGHLKLQMYGHQLIFEFELYNTDTKTNEPTDVVMYTPEGNTVESSVKVSSFIYHEYKKKGEDKDYIEGEFQTAITPNSKITKVLTHLGWTFSEEDADPEEYIGNFVELNIDDYEQKSDSGNYTASTIKDISQLKITDEESKEITTEVQEQIDKLEESKKKLDNLKETEGITEKGYTDAIEQIEHDIKKLKA